MRVVQEIMNIVSDMMVTVCMNRIVNLALIIGAISFSCHPTCSTGTLSNVSLHVHNMRDCWHVPNDDNEISV